MKNADWNPDVSTEKGYSLDIHSENKIIMVGFYEERIHIFDEGYYKVINGPIDISNGGIVCLVLTLLKISGIGFFYSHS